jgi:Molybdopterin-binding domain of aldehyde dehydrogenase
MLLTTSCISLCGWSSNSSAASSCSLNSLFRASSCHLDRRPQHADQALLPERQRLHIILVCAADRAVPSCARRFDCSPPAMAASVHVYPDGSVLVASGGLEMGQGLFTKVKQVTQRSRCRLMLVHASPVRGWWQGRSLAAMQQTSSKPATGCCSQLFRYLIS